MGKVLGGIGGLARGMIDGGGKNRAMGWEKSEGGGGDVGGGEDGGGGSTDGGDDGTDGGGGDGGGGVTLNHSCNLLGSLRLLKRRGLERIVGERTMEGLEGRT